MSQAVHDRQTAWQSEDQPIVVHVALDYRRIDTVAVASALQLPAINRAYEQRVLGSSQQRRPRSAADNMVPCLAP